MIRLPNKVEAVAFFWSLFLVGGVTPGNIQSTRREGSMFRSRSSEPTRLHLMMFRATCNAEAPTQPHACRVHIHTPVLSAIFQPSVSNLLSLFWGHTYCSWDYSKHSAWSNKQCQGPKPGLLHALKATELSL